MRDEKSLPSGEGQTSFQNTAVAPNDAPASAGIHGHVQAPSLAQALHVQRKEATQRRWRCTYSAVGDRRKAGALTRVPKHHRYRRRRHDGR
ncbi:hypothetical protein MTO96_027669 [Rhipicephalus appendiculatus]